MSLKFVSLSSSVVEKIATMLPKVNIESYPGRFDVTELKRISTKLPAVRIAFMGSTKIDMMDTGENEATVRLAAFVITGDRRGLPKDSAALNIVEALLTLIPGQSWGVPGTTIAKNIKADNLYSGQVDRQGVAIWALTWEQTTRIGADVWGGGTLPTDIYVAYDRDDFGIEPEYTRLSENEP